jgi:hypothetical protein
MAPKNVCRKGRKTISEVMTIIISFHKSHHRDFKNFYKGYVTLFYHQHFPKLLSYTTRFLEVMPQALVPLCSYFTTFKGKPTGVKFIDSTTLSACHNSRIPLHKSFLGVTQRGRSTMGDFMVLSYL